MGISIKSKSKDGFVLSVDSIENETKQYGLKVTATLDDGTVLPSVTKDVTLEYIPVSVISVTGAATITDQGSHAYTLAYGPADANVGVASVEVTTDKISDILAVTSQSTSGFTLRAGSLSTTANMATVTVKATLTNGVEVTQTKSVTLQKVTASISGPESFKAKGGSGSQAYTFAYTPSDHTSTISLRSATSSNSAFTITSATAAGFTLGIVDMPAEPDTISTTVTAVLVIDGEEVSVTKSMTAAYDEIIVPFVIYNTSSARIIHSNGAPEITIEYAVLDAWTPGSAESYDYSTVEYESLLINETREFSIPNGGAMLITGKTVMAWGNSDSENRFSLTYGACFEGNIMALLKGQKLQQSYAFKRLFYDCAITAAPALPATTLTERCYQDMFYSCIYLATAPTLPATTLAYQCYQQMFYYCINLTTAPALPATTLAGGCYQGMFKMCKKLTTAPALQATTLAQGCYNNMFSECTSLTTAPALPATTLANSCYYQMFYGCTSLTTAPALSATTLEFYCCYQMFWGCTSLKTAPALPATTLDQKCYYEMFSGCTSLTTAPALPATTLKPDCYSFMFNGCRSLTTAPDLPATTLADYCYLGMFAYCTGLKTAPALPATTLEMYCYSSMFLGCTSLTTAPTLPATTLIYQCYNQMFRYCSSLSYVKAMFTTTPDNSYTGAWLSVVASTGTFVKNSAATWNVTGANGVPDGWTIKLSDGILDVPEFKANNGAGSVRCEFGAFLEGHTISVSSSNSAFTISGQDSTGFTLSVSGLTADASTTLTLSYTEAGSTTSYTKSVTAVYTEVLQPFILYNAGASATVGLQRTASVPMTKMYYAVVNDYQEGQDYDDSSVEYSVYENTGTSALTIATVPQGSALLLKAYEKKRWSTSYSIYTKFIMTSGSFKAYGAIGSLDGYGNKLADYCYYYIFQSCTGLTQAPALPATTLACGCYLNMFASCTSLTTAPALPATALANSCYSQMFYGCTGLTAAPALPATTLDENCYQYMFRGCTSLTTAPALPATTLVYQCYYGMFFDCTKLSQTPALPATTLAQGCYNNMFRGCTSLTTAPALPATTLASECYQNMFWSCTGLTTAPALPATTLASFCYRFMFNGCTKLNYVKAMFTTEPGSSYTDNWLSDVAARGKFVKNQAATWNKTGTSGVPSGWTIEYATE